MAKQIYPDMDSVLKMMDTADNPDNESRNPKEFFKLLRKIKDVNTRIAGHITTRNSAVASFGWRLMAFEDGADDKSKIASINLRPTIQSLINSHALTHVYGHRVVLLQWNLIESFWIPNILKSNYENYECYESVFYSIVNSKKSVLVESPEVLLDASSSANTVGGVMRSVLLNELLRLEALKEQANFIKKLKGILQVINKGGDGDDQRNAEQAAAQVVKNNYTVTSDMIEFKLNQIVSTGGMSFKDVLQSFNNDIAIGFLGQANTSELPSNGGSRAAVQILKLVSADIHYTDIIHFENFINSQLLRHYYLRNYNIEPDCRFEIALEEEIDLEANATAVKAILDTGLPFYKKEIYAKLGLSIPEATANTEDIIQIQPLA